MDGNPTIAHNIVIQSTVLTENRLNGHLDFKL